MCNEWETNCRKFMPTTQWYSHVSHFSAQSLQLVSFVFLWSCLEVYQLGVDPNIILKHSSSCLLDDWFAVQLPSTIALLHYDKVIHGKFIRKRGLTSGLDCLQVMNNYFQNGRLLTFLHSISYNPVVNRMLHFQNLKEDHCQARNWIGAQSVCTHQPSRIPVWNWMDLDVCELTKHLEENNASSCSHMWVSL